MHRDARLRVGRHAPGRSRRWPRPSSRRTTSCSRTAWPSMHCGPSVEGRAQVAIALNPYPVWSRVTPDLDRDAAVASTACRTGSGTTPILRGRYPDDVLEDFSRLGPGHIRRQRSGTDRRPVDAPVVGPNYYRRHHVRRAGRVRRTGRLTVARLPRHRPRHPRCTAHRRRVADRTGGAARSAAVRHSQYDAPSLYVHESGAAYDDVPRGTGDVRDSRSDRYLDAHLRAATATLTRRRPPWLLRLVVARQLEWAGGYTHRFDIVHVDFATLQRTPKASARWYGSRRPAGTLDPVPGEAYPDDGPPEGP